MTDDTTAPEGEMPEDVEDIVTPEAPPAPQDGDEEEFDKDRALKTIRTLRGFEKQAKTLTKRLTEYEQREQEAENARLSDQERLTKRLTDLEAERDRDRQASRERVNRYEVQLSAQRLGIVDTDAAVKLLDWSTLEYDEDGTPSNVEEAVKELLTTRPYLAGQPERRTAASAVTNPATRTTAPGQRRYSSEQLRDRSFYLANRDDIEAAYREGRIDT